MDEILQEFLAESWENLSRLDTEIVELEKSPEDTELLAGIFRTVHTIKGTCGFIGLNQLNAVAHSAENVLGQMRNGRIEVTPNAVSLILEAVDRIKDLLKQIEATGNEPEVDNSSLIQKLDSFAQSADSGPESQGPQPQGPSDAPGSGVPSAASLPDSPGSDTPADPQAADAGTKPDSCSTDTSETETSQESARKGIADLSIRVNVDVLDSLMNLVGELVLTRNQLLQMARGDEESRYAAPITQLNRVTTDLQEGVMKTRMQPIGNAWSKLPRIVRDLAQSTGKQVELEMSGSETELDRTVLDAIKDPLTHMVRNSVDHGIETPEVRRAEGKAEVGRVKLNAYHEGGHVIITIEDDGAGIDLERIKQKAVGAGLVSEADAAGLAENEILSFIFQPGFSTAANVTSISGRGVGMDVVKTQIEKIGGTVDLSSTLKSGTAVRIKIPLTLAIISALVVESGGQPFAIPQLGVVELVRLAAEDRHKIETIHDKEVLRLRDRLLPLVHLDRILGQPAAENERDVNIVVVQVGDDEFGLIVSEVFDTEEIVVKPVSSLLKEIDIYQGTTILGDGRVIMILDVAGIATQFGGVSSSAGEIEADDDQIEQRGETTSLLLFNSDGHTKMAVPLSLVARLEEIPRTKIERTGDRLVVQYRGDLLPLIPVEGYRPADSEAETQPVIVFADEKNSMGLMIGEVEDIAHERLMIRRQSQRPGVLGSAIVNGRATDVIDTQYYLLQADPDWFLSHEKDAAQRVLVVDDSIFFRQLASTALEAEGYCAVTVEGARQAMAMIERGERFDMIISDLDMPEMDGWQFVKWLRDNSAAAGVPVVAMTALSGETHESRALSAGFDRFLRKFDTGQLLRMIEELCIKTEKREKVAV